MSDTANGTVLVTGATGFVGSNLCTALVASGYDVVAMVRDPVPDNKKIDGVSYVLGDVTKAESISPDYFGGCSYVIHLVGIITEVRGRGQTFSEVHVRGTRNIVRAAQNAGIEGRRFVYLSALGAALNSKSEYNRTKAQAEEIVHNSGLPYVIIRPSIILGKNGDFVRQIEALIRRPPLSPFPLPFVPVPGSGKNRFQPLNIADLMIILRLSLSSDAAVNRTFEVGGGTQVTFRELLLGFAKRLGIHKRLLSIPLPIMFAAASIFEAIFPEPPITVDQLLNLKTDNICDNSQTNDVFDLAPMTFEQSLDEIYSC